MGYESWMEGDQLSDDAFDWASNFADEYDGDASANAIKKALPPEMGDRLKDAISSVVIGLSYGFVALVTKPVEDESSANP